MESIGILILDVVFGVAAFFMNMHIHEMCHWLTSRSFGVVVEECVIGRGKQIASWRWHGTRFVLKLQPTVGRNTVAHYPICSEGDTVDFGVNYSDYRGVIYIIGYFSTLLLGGAIVWLVTDIKVITSIASWKGLEIQFHRGMGYSCLWAEISNAVVSAWHGIVNAAPEGFLQPLYVFGMVTIIESLMASFPAPKSDTEHLMALAFENATGKRIRPSEHLNIIRIYIGIWYMLLLFVVFGGHN